MVLWQLLVLGGTLSQPRGPRQQFLPPPETCIARALYCWLWLSVRSRHHQHGENSWHCCPSQGSSFTCGNMEMLLLASPRAAALCSHGKCHTARPESGSEVSRTPGVELASCLFLPAWCISFWRLAQASFLGLSSWLFPQAFPRSFRL